MKTSFLRAAAAALSFLSVAAPAHAQGLVAEGNLARSHGDWGGELGAGLDMSSGPFTLRPMVGAFFGDKTRAYVKGEATVSIATVEAGAGVRLISDHVRAYGTASLPLAPMVRLKGNLGDGYGAIGLNLRF